MVDMGMGQEHEINRRRVEREWLMVARRRRAAALNHAAIHQEAYVERFHQETRPGDFARSAQKMQFHGMLTPVFSFVSGKCSGQADGSPDSGQPGR
jgi:hypothetical protein